MAAFVACGRPVVSVTLETINPWVTSMCGRWTSQVSSLMTLMAIFKKIGLTIYQPDMEPIIAQVTPESAGSRAGLRAGDRILEVNRKQIALWEELVQEIRANPGALLRLRIQRNSETVSIEVIPDTATEGSEKVGKLGIGPKIDQAEFEKLMVEISYAPGTAMVRAISKTWETCLPCRCWGKCWQDKYPGRMSADR